MNKKMLEVCCHCLKTGVTSGQLDGDVWCPHCQDWVYKSLILPESEVIALRNGTLRTISYKPQQAEMIYRSILYVLRMENIDYEEKHEQLLDQMRETDAVHLADLLDGLYDFIKSTNDYDEEDDEDEE